MVIGGGGVGESEKASEKTRVVDLKADAPRFEDGPDLYARARATRSSVVLPDDTVLTTSGSGDYRGRSDSNILQARDLRPEEQHLERRRRPAGGPQLPLRRRCCCPTGG